MVNKDSRKDIWIKRQMRVVIFFWVYIRACVPTDLTAYLCGHHVSIFPPAAGLMHKFQAHAATDVTGFGLLGHANNLATQQRNDVAFVIHNLPIIAKMAAVSKACGNIFNLVQGTSSETSGNTASTNNNYSCSETYRKNDIVIGLVPSVVLLEISKS